ncbi:hypothetical protein GGI07_000565 [Coemansia sp. Benny D115]|nr:hypothetical protein GGI07_000565 [Coemansia sp. Benny D115]
MSPRVPTAFRPLETTSSMGLFEAPVPRRTATAAPVDRYAQERLQLLSRLEQRWYPARPSSCAPRSNCVAPVPTKSFVGSRPMSASSSQSDVSEDDAACLELRGILGYVGQGPASSRSSSATSSFYAESVDSDMGLFPLEEIVVCPHTPPMRSHNPVPLNSSFGGIY